MRPWFILHIARCMLQVDLIVYMVSCRSHASHCKLQLLSCRYQVACCTLHVVCCTSCAAGCMLCDGRHLPAGDDLIPRRPSASCANPTKPLFVHVRERAASGTHRASPAEIRRLHSGYRRRLAAGSIIGAVEQRQRFNDRRDRAAHEFVDLSAIAACDARHALYDIQHTGPCSMQLRCVLRVATLHVARRTMLQ